MLKWIKWLCVLASVGSVAVAGYFMLTAKQSIQELIDATVMTAVNRIENPDIKTYDGDRLSWRLQAESAQERDQLVMLQQPVVALFTEEGDVIPIRALAGQYDKETGYMRFDGEVELGFLDWQLSTQQLEVSQGEGELRIKESFVLQQEGIKITGRDMIAWHKEGRIQVLKGIHMDIEVTQ